jgi:DNA-binding response OmpR family regulator
MRLLLADNNRDRANAMQAALGRGGFATDWVRTGMHLREAVSTLAYDCGVVGIPLPDLSVDSLLEFITRKRAGLPVILVTDAGSAPDHAALRRKGVADCLVRPVNVEALTARIHALHRGCEPHAEETAPLTYGPLRLNIEGLCAFLADREVGLTECECSILATLMRCEGRLCSSRVLEESLPGQGSALRSIAVEICVHYLRRKLAPGVIVTVKGAGYRMMPMQDSGATVWLNPVAGQI